MSEPTAKQSNPGAIVLGVVVAAGLLYGVVVTATKVVALFG